MMKSKFELPESIFSVTKGLPIKPKPPLSITQSPSAKTNKLLDEQLNFLIRSSEVPESNAQKSLKIAKWAIIIAIIVIILSMV